MKQQTHRAKLGRATYWPVSLWLQTWALGWGKSKVEDRKAAAPGMSRRAQSYPTICTKADAAIPIGYALHLAGGGGVTEVGIFVPRAALILEVWAGLGPTHAGSGEAGQAVGSGNHFPGGPFFTQEHS